MKIFYGGIEFKVVRVLSMSRQPVLDDNGVDYLFTRFQINAAAIVNADQSVFDPNGTKIGMAYGRDASSDGPPPGIRAAGPDFTNPFLISPVATDSAIRHWLAVPRRELKVTDLGGAVLLHSPKPPRVCDAHNGPTVDVYSIQEVMGDAKTFVVNFQVTTYINECEENEYLFAPALSNRFSQHHELDEDYFLTIVTQGTAHFRTDYVHSIPLNPDAIRPFLFLPIPIGFKRENIRIQMRGDAATLDYAFVDRQHQYQFVGGNAVNATRVEANYRAALYSGEDPLGVVLSAMERAYNFKWSKKAGDEPTDGAVDQAPKKPFREGRPPRRTGRRTGPPRPPTPKKG